ncbi:putative major sperm protein (MSP) [Helianthus annuus]|nr:putative major sperm protein (MSP) [Helianthus annuus]KAJ0739825.1 putative major sperm protein (MSP) [Helianthus annuus]
MSTGDLLSIEPQELQFAFELKKQISCSMQLQNKTDDHVAFKVKTTNPKKYCVRPNSGIVFPRSTCDIIAGFWFLSVMLMQLAIWYAALEFFSVLHSKNLLIKI